MALFRKVVFGLFVVLYLALCPVMILYSLGYAWAPGAQRHLVKTGLLSIASAPPGASVYVGKRHYTKKTPAILRGLFPGSYHLKVALKGYRPWSRLVSVEPEKATVLERILLLPDQLRIELRLSGPFEQLLPVPGGHQFLLIGPPPARAVTVYDWHAERAWPLPSLQLAADDGSVTVATSVQESPAVLLRIEGSAGVRWVWVDLKGKETRVEDLTGRLQARLTWAGWDPSARHELFLCQGRLVSRLSLGSGMMAEEFLAGLRGCGIAHKRLYLLTDAQVVERLDLQGRSREPFLEDPALSRILSNEPEPLRLTALSDELFIFLGARGGLVSSWPPYRQAASGVIGLDYDAPRERLLLWQRGRVGILAVPKTADDSPTSEDEEGVRWLVTGGRRIEQALWVYEGSHVLIRDADRVQLVDTSVSSEAPVEDLLQVKEGSAVAYIEDAGTLYYLDRTSGALSAMQLLPKPEPLTLPFAEP